MNVGSKDSLFVLAQIVEVVLRQERDQDARAIVTTAARPSVQTVDATERIFVHSD